MPPSVSDEQKTTVPSLADKEVMPCSALAKEWRFGNKANRSFGKLKGRHRRGSAPMFIRIGPGGSCSTPPDGQSNATTCVLNSASASSFLAVSSHARLPNSFGPSFPALEVLGRACRSPRPPPCSAALMLRPRCRGGALCLLCSSRRLHPHSGPLAAFDFRF